LAVALAKANSRMLDSRIPACLHPTQRTASDELYHATWANATGVRRVLLPLPARLLAVNSDLDPAALDERTWLARLHVRRSVWDTWRTAVQAQTQAARE
jgi:hypothetical protein